MGPLSTCLRIGVRDKLQPFACALGLRYRQRAGGETSFDAFGDSHGVATLYTWRRPLARVQLTSLFFMSMPRPRVKK